MPLYDLFLWIPIANGSLNGVDEKKKIMKEYRKA